MSVYAVFRSSSVRASEVDLDRLEDAFISSARKLFAGLLSAEMPALINEAIRQGAKKIELPGRKRYIALYRAYMWELYAAGILQARKEIEEIRDRTMARHADIRWDVRPDPVIPERAVRWIDKWTDYFGSDYYDSLTAEVVRILRDTLAEGLSEPEVMEALKSVLVGEEYGPARLRVIARTNATTAYNQGRIEQFRGDKEFVPAVEFIAILDDRVTDECESRHGMIFGIDSKELASNTPPLHYNCRSILVPVDRYTLEEMRDPKWRDVDGKSYRDKTDYSGFTDLPDGFGNIDKAVS